MKTPLDIAIVGCGRAAERLYLPALADAPSVRVVAAVDPTERRDFIASQIDGCKPFADVEAMLREAPVAAAVVATPPQFHVPAALTLIRHGLGVLIEKPLALTLDGVDELQREAAARRARVMLGFNRRFWRPIGRLREALRGQALRGTRATLHMTSDAAGWGALTGAADALDDLGSHQIDLLRYALGREVRAVTATRDRATITFTLDFGDDVLAECVAGQADVSQERIAVRTPRGAYAIRLGSEQIAPASGPVRAALDVLDGVKRKATGTRSSFKMSYAAELEAFARGLREGTPPSPSLDDGVATLRVVDAARRSAASGERVVVAG